eukprot:5318915-Prymnesium_polylepis.1
MAVPEAGAGPIAVAKAVLGKGSEGGGRGAADGGSGEDGGGEGGAWVQHSCAAGAPAYPSPPS